MQEPQAESTDFLEPNYQEVLALIMYGRWTEAQRAIEQIREIDPDYKKIATLATMVDEVIQTSFYGFRVPPHVAAHQSDVGWGMEEDDEEPPPPPPRRRTRWPLVLGGVIVVLMLIAIWMMFPR
ncbi:MAG: hypothetical protein U0556_05315 [Dehalococcoidia bacterium]